MEEVIGLRGLENVGSLMDWGVKYKEVALTDEGSVDLAAIKAAITPGSYSPSTVFLVTATHYWCMRSMKPLTVK